MSGTAPVNTPASPAAAALRLRKVAQGGDVAEFEAAWLEELADPPPAAAFLDALGALPDGLRGASATSLLGLLLEASQQRARHADVLAVARALHPYRQQKIDLRPVVLGAVQGLHGGEPWHALYLELSGLDGRTELDDALDVFDRLLGLRPASPVNHRSGWGEGLVLAHDLPARGFTVRFRRDGMTRAMPFTTGLDVLTPLPATDLRARLLCDLEGLRREAEESPERVLRAVARLHKGRAGVKEIKDWLAGEVVEARSWNSWWKKAKAAGSADPWLSVDNPARPVFLLRERALSQTDELQGMIDRAPNLAGLLAVLRGALALDPPEDARRLALDALRQRLASEPDPVARIEAACLLARHGEIKPIEAGAEVERALAAGRGFAALAGALPDASARREAFEAFAAARGALWSDALVGELFDLNPQLLDQVADRLQADGRADALANRFRICLLTPSRHAEATLRLSRRFLDGHFDGVPGAPTLHDVVLGLLHLAETQAPRAARGDKPAKELVRLLLEVLVERKGGLLAPFGAAASRHELSMALTVLARCKSMPDEIGAALVRSAHERFPDLAPKDEVPFWETNVIWSTRAGIARRREEYRVLTQEKIPANSADIGRAASYGDLSENYEWTAAIEQQRQLTEKAAAMEAELKLAQALEEAEIPAGIVAPGVSVTFVQSGAEQTLSILGPWDIGAAGVISYRAPLAAGMLGAKVGETVTVTLPAGPSDVTVKAIASALA